MLTRRSFIMAAGLSAIPLLLPKPLKARMFKGGGTTDPASPFLTLPGSPTAIYSLVRTQSWLGPCMRVQRSSGTPTQKDIGFTPNNRFDMAGALAFAGAGTLTCVKWYDQSGNTNDATVGSDAPLLRTENTFQGLQPISFIRSNGDVGLSNLNIPSSVSLSRQSYTAASALIVGGGLFDIAGYFGLGVEATDVDNVSVICSTNGGVMCWKDSSTHNGGAKKTFTPQSARSSNVIVRSDATTAKIRVNGNETSAAAATATTLTGGYIGKGGSASPYAGCEMFSLVIYNTALSSSDCALIEAQYVSFFNVTQTFTKQIVMDGDSITAGYNNGDYILTMARQLNPLLTGTPGTFNIAISGQTMATIYGNRANATARYNSSFGKNINYIFAGTNDIAGASSGNIVGLGTTIFNSYLLPYVLAMQAASYSSVTVCTMLPRLWTGSGTDQSQKEAERLVYNGLILSSAAANNYTVIDFASLFPDPAVYTTGGGSTDGIHPTVATYGTMATMAAASINPLL